MSQKNISFWSGVSKNGKELTQEEQLMFCRNFNKMLVTSPELAKIFFNTQVYNEIVNGVTTRGGHSEGVAIVAESLSKQKAKLDGKSNLESEISGELAKSLGYMHDLGHTPFGHDGEGALGTEMERFEATKDYKDKRVALFGEDYTIQAGDDKAETMCYEHNETSSVIGSQLLIKFAQENGYTIDSQAVQYIKTGILAHSTSRVKTEPDGIEQKAVRLADKVAYIPQDLLDLLKQGVLHIDDLTPEEQGLIGLNEEQQTLKEKLRNVNKMKPILRVSLYGRLDSIVKGMQYDIAQKCFEERNGEMQLDGKKDIVDYFDMAVNKPKTLGEKLEKGYVPPLRKELCLEGEELFKQMRDAQKHRREIGHKVNEDGTPEIEYEDYNKTKTPEEIKQIIDKKSNEYRQFLIDKAGINPTLATLWVTKAKYQDAFIVGELTRDTQDEQGKTHKESLADINRRYENGWKMKSTFQFFYSNIEQVPQEFRDKYKGENGEVYTEQQIVSAYIASFTNKGLNELYNGLIDKKLVLSREDALAQLKEARPDLSVDKVTSKDLKIQNPQKPDETYKIAANDILEFLYEENIGRTIVSGKNQNPDRIIPQIQHSIAVRDVIDSTRDKSAQQTENIPQLLASTIDVSRTQVNSKDIQQMVAYIRNRQQSQEIQKHIDEVNKSEGR